MRKLFLTLILSAPLAQAQLTIGWFIAPINVDLGYPLKDHRACQVFDFATTVRGDGGQFQIADFGNGQYCIAKVKAASATLTSIGAAANVVRVPVATLGSSLSTLSTAQRNLVTAILQSAGYSSGEITVAIPNLATSTLRQLITFALTRNKLCRYDSATDANICDGATATPFSADDLDRGLQ